MNFTYNNKVFSNFTLEMGLAAGVPQDYLLDVQFSHTRQEKLAEINNAAQRDLDALLITYPKGEITSFDKQESEARAYLDDAAAPTPLLNALAEHREMDKDELVRRVIEKADAFAAASGAIIGKRQKLEDALNVLTSDANTLNDIAAITW
jgi:hypothetical protein